MLVYIKQYCRYIFIIAFYPPPNSFSLPRIIINITLKYIIYFSLFLISSFSSLFSAKGNVQNVL